MYEAEIESLKNHSWALQEKIRSQTVKLGNLKEENNSKLMKIRIQELESELEYYKSLINSKRDDQNLSFDEFSENKQ